MQAHIRVRRGRTERVFLKGDQHDAGEALLYLLAWVEAARSAKGLTPSGAAAE